MRRERWTYEELVPTAALVGLGQIGCLVLEKTPGHRRRSA